MELKEEVCLPEAQGDVRLFGAQQVSDGEGGETQKAPLTEKVRESGLTSHSTVTKSVLALILIINPAVKHIQLCAQHEQTAQSHMRAFAGKSGLCLCHRSLLITMISFTRRRIS